MAGRLLALLLSISPVLSMSIDMLDVSSMEPIEPNYCNNSDLLASAGLYRSTLGQFLGFDCSQEFFHCRWQSDGFRTYRKLCKTGLVYDVHGTQNCNYDYNVKSCGITGNGPAQCNSTDFLCPLSGQCVSMAQRCDGRYDCSLEEDEQNCPLCAAGEFACIVSEQCIPLDRRCNGLSECSDGTDENNCDVCGHGFFHCGKSNECVPIDQRCDGRRQCPHGEDELLCKKSAADSKFTCQSRNQEIPIKQVCDGVPQCDDQSDEAYCDMGVAAGGAISFSSNLNKNQPKAPEPPVEEEEYDYEEEPEKTGPSFPMLSLVTQPPASPTTIPASTTRPTTRPTTVPTTQRPVTAFSRPRPKIQPPQQVNKTEIGGFPPQMKQAVAVSAVTAMPRVVQAVEITAPTTAPVNRVVAAKPVPVDVQGKKVKYPTRGVAEVLNTVRVTSAPTIRPRNQSPHQLYEKSVAPQLHLTSTAPTPSTPQHALIVEVTSPPIPAQQMKENLLRQLNAQISNGMTPELMGKIEKLLTAELGNTMRRRPASGRDASISPAALIRTFTSKVQIPQ